MTAPLPRSGPSLTLALRMAGMSMAVIGFVTLVGWAMASPALTQWGADTLPMAPITAGLAVLFGAALGLCASRPVRRGGVRLAMVFAWVGAVAALGVFALRLGGVRWPVEHLGFHIDGTFRGLDIGYISPVTAACFLLANVSLLASLSFDAVRPWRRWLAAGLGGSVSVAGFALLLAYAFGAPLLSGDAVIPAALNTSLVVLLSGLALLVLVGGPIWEGLLSPGRPRKGRLVFAVAFTAVAAMIVGGAYGYYRREELELRRESERQLETVSQLKLSQLVQWRNERFGDAAILFRNASLSTDFRRFLERDDDAATRRRLDAWLVSSLAHHEYDRTFLIDARGTTWRSLPQPAAPPSAAILSQVPEVLRTGQVTLLDFYLDERDQRVYLATLIPILDESRANHPLGVLVLRVDPDRFLYPFLGSWPAPNTTAESLLARREGAGVIFLSKLNDDSSGALGHKASMEQTDVLAVQAVLGHTGVAEGLDYRGVPALGVLRSVPESPWYLVTKMDIAEFNATLWERLWTVVAFGGVVLFGVASGLGFIWRDQRARFYRKQVNLAGALRAREAQLAELINAVDGIVWEADAETFRFTFVSPRAERLLGYPLSRWTEEPTFWADHIHPDEREQTVQYCAQCTQDKRDHEFEYRMRGADGRYIWLRDIVTVAVEAGRPAKLRGIMVDITEHRQAAVSLVESEERLRLALSGATQGLWDLDVQTGEVMVSPEYATMLGYDPSDFHETDAMWTERLHPDDRAHAAGAFDDYIAGRSDAYRVEFRQRAKNGDWKWILSAGKLVSQAPDGQPLRMLGTHIDITVRKNAELRSQRLAQLYAAVGQCNDAIVRCKSETDLFPQICQVAVTLGGVAMAWIGLTDETSGMVTPVASYGAGAECLDGIRISLEADDPLGRGLTATAIRENRAAWSMDLQNDPSAGPWHEPARRAGWVASGSLPLFRNSACVGALTIYAASADMFDDDGCTLLKEMAADISFALDNYAREADRELAVARLRDREFLLAESQRIAHIGSWTTKLGGNNEWSKEVFHLFGVADAESPPDMGTFLSLIHPDDQSAMRSWVESAWTGAPTRDLEFRVPRPDGEIRYLSGRGEMVSDRGQPYLTGTVQDVTDRVRADKELRRQSALLERVVNGTSDPVFVKDLLGRFLLFNKAAERFTGKRAEEVLGQDDRFLFPADEAAENMTNDRRIIEAGRITTCTERVTSAAGPVRIFESTKGPIFDETGSPIGLFGVARDITDRVEAADEIRRRKEFVETLLEFAPIGFALNTIDDGKAVFVSGNFEKIYGVPPGSLHGVADFFERVFLDPVYREQMRERIMADMATGEAARMHWEDISITTQAGEHRVVSGVNIPLLDQNLMISTVQDVTDRWRAENDLRSSLQEKEALVREVHHRVKNNLQVIMSLLRLEAKRNGHAAVKAVLDDMQGRMQSMALLHETLYRSGDLTQVDLAQYLTRVASQLFRASAPRSGAVALELNLTSAHIALDQAIPCGLIVNELVSNCLKHGFPGGRSGEVRIGLQPVDGGPQLRLQIRDTGMGLPADFEARRHESLGLQLVSDLVRQLNGTLDIGHGIGASFDLVFLPKGPGIAPASRGDRDADANTNR